MIKNFIYENKWIFRTLRHKQNVQVCFEQFPLWVNWLNIQSIESCDCWYRVYVFSYVEKEMLGQTAPQNAPIQQFVPMLPQWQCCTCRILQTYETSQKFAVCKISCHKTLHVHIRQKSIWPCKGLLTIFSNCITNMQLQAPNASTSSWQTPIQLHACSLPKAGNQHQIPIQCHLQLRHVWDVLTAKVLLLYMLQ